MQFDVTPNELCMQAATEENSPKLTDLMQSEFFFCWVATKLCDC